MSRFVAKALELGGCAALVLAFTFQKLAYDPPLADGLDGAYYLQIARHVAQGDGLVTSLSPFHLGLDPLPHAVTSYPLWPWLLGGVGRFVGLGRAAQILPEVLFGLSLTLAYVWLRRGIPRSFPRLGRVAPLIAASLTAWLGVNPVYHWASSRPYTESLSVCLVLATLLGYAAARRLRPRSATLEASAFAAVGLCAGLCYLARFQLLAVAVSLVFVELWSRRQGRGRRALGLLGGSALPIGAWAVRCLSLPNAELRMLFDFASYRQLSSLPPHDYTVPCGSFAACALDKLGGLALAFSPVARESYVWQFGLIAYAFPVAAVAFAVCRPARHALAKSLRRDRHAAFWASALLGVLAVAPIHGVHSLHWYAWAFGWRQGLPLAFTLVPIVLAFGSRALRADRARARRFGPWLAGASTLLVLHVLVTLGLRSAHLGDGEPTDADFAAQRAAGAYLQRFALHERTLGMEPQAVSAFTDAPLDWLACWSEPEVAETLVRERRVSRALLRPSELGCRSLARIRARLSLRAMVGSGNDFGVFAIDSPATR